MVHLLVAIFKTVDRKTVIFGLIETAIILLLAWYCIFKKPAPEIKVIDNSKEYKDSIKQLLTKYNSVQLLFDKKTFSFDSLVFVKRYTYNAYEEKRKYEKTAPIDTVSAFVRRELKSAK